MKYFLVFICLFLFLCGCDNTMEPEPTDISPTPAVSNEEEEDIHQEPVDWPNGPYEDTVADIAQQVGFDMTFTLTDAQQALYDSYTKDFNFDISVFNGASPMDIAHVYIECGINGLWEGEYNLYYFKTEHLSKRQYRDEFLDDISKRDLRTRRSFANIMFPFLKEGTFVDAGDGSGYIEFVSLDTNYVELYEVKTKMNFQLIDGVWKVHLNPFETEL